MDVRKKVLLVGIAIAMLSAAIATQYARVSIAYEYGISATDGAIRFIARDFAPDGKYVLQNDSNTLKLVLGKFTPGTNKTYTAAFGIVNEENFSIYLYNISVTGSGAQYMKIWLHKNPNISAEDDDNKTLVWDGEHGGYTNFNNITFYAGNNDPSDANSSNGEILTPLSDGIRYNTTSGTIGSDNDYWWVQITLDIPQGVSGTYNGNILFKFTTVQ